MSAGADMSFRIGQRVKHQEYAGKPVTGVVRQLSIDNDRGLLVSIVLDAPIVIPAGNGFAETKIWNQHAPAHEFSPFDERDELLADLVALVRISIGNIRSLGPAGALARVDQPYEEWLRQLEAIYAKATGSAA